MKRFGFSDCLEVNFTAIYIHLPFIGSNMETTLLQFVFDIAFFSLS